MTCTIIAALAANGVIGREGRLPWNLPADLARFKRLTSGHIVVMGRRTWESIGRPLPGRRVIVLSRDPGWRAGADGIEHARSLQEAIGLAGGDDVFVAGGREVYADAIPLAGALELTIVHVEAEGDVRFPEIDLGRFRLVAEEPHPADDRHAHAFTFRTYVRDGG